MANYNETNLNLQGEERSYFDGGYWGHIGYSLLVGFVSVITLGIAYPWMVCKFQRWKARHTVVCGKRMSFDGKGVQLIGKYILWSFLTLITFGIYGFWMSISLKKWFAKHTHFVGEEDNNSYFDGGIGGLIGTNILSFIVFFIPFVGAAWGSIIRLKWETKHTVVDSRRLIFTGTVGSLFLKYLLWGFLTVITFGIFAWFKPVKQMRWETENTIDNEHTTDELIKKSEYRTNVHTDASTFKTWRVEEQMESMKAGITDTISESDLKNLADTGSRAAMYEYVVRFADKQYRSEPFSSMLKMAADAEYAPAMCLYVQTHPMEEAAQREMMIKAAEKGQLWAVRAAMRMYANEGLQMKENKNALPTLKNAVRYGDLLLESGETLTENEATLIKNCTFAIRRIQSAQLPSSGGKVAAIIALVICVPMVIAMIAAVFSFFMLRLDMGGALDGKNPFGGSSMGVEDSGNYYASDINTMDFWETFAGRMENDFYYNIEETDVDGNITTYELTCNKYFWSSRYYVSVTDYEGLLQEVRVRGDRVVEPDGPDPTMNQQEVSYAMRIVYESLGLGEYDELTPYEESGVYNEYHGNWVFQYDNSSTELNLYVTYTPATMAVQMAYAA